ncbi:MAG: hypothetical protein ACXWVW_03270, partial [Sulfuricurvum sp.]
DLLDSVSWHGMTRSFYFKDSPRVAIPSFLINTERAQAPSALKILSIGVLTKWLSFQGSPTHSYLFTKKLAKKKARYCYHAIPLSTSQAERKLILLHDEIITHFLCL